MNKTSHNSRGLKCQEHIDRVLHNLEMYIAHYRVPQPQQLREATAQLIAGNLGPRNAFYYDIQNEIYRLLHHQVEYLINFEIQQEQELQQENEKETQEPRFKHKPTQKSIITIHPLAYPVALEALTTLNSLTLPPHPPP